MPHAWLPGDPGDDEMESLFAQDRDAWRGDVHSAAAAWRPDSDDGAWRGEAHLADWPESSAGPEYWMYKRAAEGG
jgi:hypothetical protein